MQVRARLFPASSLLSGEGESDIWGIELAGPDLKLHVRRNLSGPGSGMAVRFPSVRSFFLTDEGDLTRFWWTPVPPGLYQVEEGGLLWSEQQAPGLLVVTAAVGAHEWLIATTGQCALVVSDRQPIVEELG